MPSYISKLILVVVALLALFIISPFATVPAGYRGVLTTFGKPSEEIYSEGLHFVWPLAQTMHRVAVAIQKRGR